MNGFKKIGILGAIIVSLFFSVLAAPAEAGPLCGFIRGRMEGVQGQAVCGS